MAAVPRMVRTASPSQDLCFFVVGLRLHLSKVGVYKMTHQSTLNCTGSVSIGEGLCSEDLIAIGVRLMLPRGFRSPPEMDFLRAIGL